MQMLGGFLILLGCFGMGLWYRQQFLGRLYTIRELIRILEQWISEIRYNGSTLPECCRQTGRQRKDRLGGCWFSGTGGEKLSQTAADASSEKRRH